MAENKIGGVPDNEMQDRTFFLPAPRASAQVVSAQSQLVGSQTLLAMLLDNIPDLLVILNSERQIVFANQSLTKFLGLGDLSSILGRRPGETLDCIHACEMEGGCGTSPSCTTCGAALALNSATAGQSDVQECRILRRNNNEALDFRVFTKPFKIGEEKFILFTLADVSHENRRRALERIFFHDVLNTAGGVHGVAQLMAIVEDDEQPELRGMMERLSKRLIDEIIAQRALAAAEIDELVPEKTPVNLADLMHETAELYRNHSVATERHIAETAPTGSCAEKPLIISDPNLLSRVLGNLLKNALEATPSGGTVTLSLECNSDYAQLSVHNTGVIPKDVQMQLFQRSFSTKGKGRGLGSYSVKLLTEKYLGGTIQFESSPKEGTTFHARYPVDSDD
ncbi:histidine kinase [candidate division BRC1 bacterium HGW-BRC1-1]|jgi:signal transduction histidine kinase|nr:MAG: histidine kinase [candidate division BRC1 bacterium HGW-BRC1-1]